MPAARWWTTRVGSSCPPSAVSARRWKWCGVTTSPRNSRQSCSRAWPSAATRLATCVLPRASAKRRSCCRAIAATGTSTYARSSLQAKCCGRKAPKRTGARLRTCCSVRARSFKPAAPARSRSASRPCPRSCWASSPLPGGLLRLLLGRALALGRLCWPGVGGGRAGRGARVAVRRLVPRLHRQRDHEVIELDVEHRAALVRDQHLLAFLALAHVVRDKVDGQGLLRRQVLHQRIDDRLVAIELAPVGLVPMQAAQQVVPVVAGVIVVRGEVEDGDAGGEGPSLLEDFEFLLQRGHLRDAAMRLFLALRRREAQIQLVQQAADQDVVVLHE